MRFTHRLVFRSKKDPAKALFVLEDAEGWLWVEKLMGTDDSIPFTKSEISLAFEVEPEEIRRLPLEPGHEVQALPV